MRILFLPHNGKLYGANKSLLSVVSYLNKRNEILLITPFKNYHKDVLEFQNIRNYNIPYYASLFYVRKNFKYVIYPFLVLLDILVFPFILYKTAIFNPDIIYSNSSMENIGIILAKLLKKKHITHVREFGDLDFEFYFIGGNKRKRLFLNKSNGLIFNSKSVRDYIHPSGMQSTKTRIIYNGVANDVGYEFLRFPSRSIVFGIVGYIYENKGQYDAVRFLKKHIKKLKNIKLEIFGDGSASYVNSIKKYINENQLNDTVIFKGFNKNVAEIYNGIDILLVFAKNEAFGRVTIEAMQNGIPVIAFNGGGTKELVDNEVTGLLFNNEIEFDKCVNNLVTNKILYESLSENSIKKANDIFSEAAYCKNIESFIMEVMEFDL